MINSSSLLDLVLGIFIVMQWKDLKSIVQYHGQKARYYMDKNKEVENDCD